MSTRETIHKLTPPGLVFLLSLGLSGCSLLTEEAPVKEESYYRIRNLLPEYCDDLGCYTIDGEDRTRMLTDLHRRLCVPVEPAQPRDMLLMLGRDG